ncbi:MAG: TIGR04255 family protein [Kineosporiaceae bacterium]
MEDREIYPNAPVVLVTLELRHPATEPLTRAERVRAARLLGAHTPIPRAGHATEIVMTAAPGSQPTQQVKQEEFPRFLSRDHRVAVAFRRDAVVVETTRYGRWEELRALVADVLEVRAEVGGVVGVERLGLRYIDEIRVPSGAESAWEPWVHHALLGPSAVARDLDLPRPALWQGLTVFPPDPDRTLALRYGSFAGHAVQPDGELKRDDSPAGPFFLLDIDSFWIPGDGTPEFDIESLLRTCDSLHAPIRSLFEHLITDRLRDEVLRRDR